MIDRFKGSNGRRLLREAIQRQNISLGQKNIAAKIAKASTTHFLPKGTKFIVQDTLDTDVYLILSGTVSIEINERQIATRQNRQHVGEMALLHASGKRSASVVCATDCEVAKITEARFSAIANQHPQIWKHLAVEISDRLRERSIRIPLKNPVPHIFIGSSGKALPIARVIADNLKGSNKINLWSKGVFKASATTIETLERQAKKTDFAVLVLNDDDLALIRGRKQLVPRDNVIFELGLFMGSIGRERTFMVVPKGVALKLPTDLLGVTVLYYRRKLEDLKTALMDACDEIIQSITEHGAK